MIGGRGPIVTVHRTTGGDKGIKCCCCMCCTCFNWTFLKTQHGILKIVEVILGFFCQTLAINYGLGYDGAIGKSYHSFLTTCSWSLMTSIILLFCYVFSEKSISLIRQSFFETAFNITACVSFLSASSYLGFAVNAFLYPMYIITPFFQVYPAMTAAYVLGFISGAVHGYDAYKSYRYFKGYR
ncbi:hypothetical protein PPYR_11257 [Photinus pyralis]|uniref:MARVEL domain-containing protein n=1 Tax=Photinus pyralis TaxID=7054 RepID=A0A5N4AAY3_PHOPY|nr:protein singles bar [Photinus pyralis]KAB0794418.1 hypothetical protein PPYR_11257 [Photinus pyralis]